MKTLFIILYATCALAFSNAAQADTRVNRDEVFLLNNERLEVKGNWKGVFCDADNQLKCELIETSITEARSTKEVLPSGKIVSSLVYQEHPNKNIKFFIKGLSTKTGRVYVETTLDVTSYSPLYFTWKGDKYTINPKMPRLLIRSDSRTGAQQWINIFNNKGICKNGEEMSDVYLKIWIGDLDGDDKPDFFIYASAPHASCWPNYSQTILVLSSGAQSNGIGKVVLGKH